MISFDFSGKTVVVVGGTSGINRGIAEGFAEQGAKVAVVSRSQDKVTDTVEALKGLGAQAMGFAADVRDFESLELGFTQVASAFGEIDVLVSGAAGNFPSLVNDMSPNGFKSVVDIDLIGTFHVMRAAYPYLTKPGACVVNISAPQSELAMIGQAHVCAAKAGVDMMTKTLAIEWGIDGIRVNGVIPGPIDGTEGMKRLAPTEKIREACRQSVPLKRMGVPKDVANACLFLASPLASYVSGAIIPVDGGWVNGGAAVAGSAMESGLRQLSAQKKNS